MANTIQEERWRWLEPIINKEMKLTDIAKVCPHSERSLKRWKKAYEQFGTEGLIPNSTAPKTSHNETSIRLKKKVSGTFVLRKSNIGFAPAAGISLVTRAVYLLDIYFSGASKYFNRSSNPDATVSQTVAPPEHRKSPKGDFFLLAVWADVRTFVY